VPGILRQLGVPPNARVLVAGSTHPGEEALIADQFLRLRKRFPDLFLILVPRHFERSRDVGRELQARDIKFLYRTEVTRGLQYQTGEVQCLLVNTTGELKYFYQQATVIFIGKSLTAQGGQNPIEPGALGKSMVFGPNMQNFAEVVRSFLEKEAAIQVRDAAELEPVMEKLLAQEELRERLGRNALEVVRENQGAIDRTVEMVVQNLEGSGLYVADK
jgi:3-deoxy-D-manno-octulosonic-acid transferase